ncbi:unnamed protein product [Orchesella dallaii]|uniref:Core Histone H2A/H2B/H3 domain-containing protein n=1 Tax=Orchesella dallaii TaxID=48710 RepID=A0ABP1PVU6_9HEXA
MNPVGSGNATPIAPTPYPTVGRRLFATPRQLTLAKKRPNLGACGSDNEERTGVPLPKRRRGAQREAVNRSGYYGIEKEQLVTFRQFGQLSIPRLSFQRLVGDVIQDVGGGSAIRRMTVGALSALQMAAEGHIKFLFGDKFLLCLHKKRTTVAEKDLLLALKIRGNTNIN